MTSVQVQLILVHNNPLILLFFLLRVVARPQRRRRTRPTTSREGVRQQTGVRGGRRPPLCREEGAGPIYRGLPVSSPERFSSSCCCPGGAACCSGGSWCWRSSAAPGGRSYGWSETSWPGERDRDEFTQRHRLIQRIFIDRIAPDDSGRVRRGSAHTFPLLFPAEGAALAWLGARLLFAAADFSLWAEPRTDGCCLAVLHGVPSESWRGRGINHRSP